MEQPLIITRENADAVWAAVERELEVLSPLPALRLELEQNERRVILELDGTRQKTTYSSIIYNQIDFRFSIHPQGFIDELGKFFGMQDAVLGYREFDEKFVVKTNQEGKAEAIFSDASTRELLQSVPGLCLGIVQYLTEDENGKVPFLELQVDGCITDVSVLKGLYDAFFQILIGVDV
ncbi:hypothetical protein [Pedobacter sp. SYSU D00535]|uniref:hypothetical protein n=1 Tax=Pedobacter sp. SYSU D00535 TaxID=2810308 RepID=UPI001A97C261|nr:hypothetical protein [Pedobacter sp. SYSU D00535]